MSSTKRRATMSSSAGAKFMIENEESDLVVVGAIKDEAGGSTQHEEDAAVQFERAAKKTETTPTIITRMEATASFGTSTGKRRPNGGRLSRAPSVLSLIGIPKSSNHSSSFSLAEPKSEALLQRPQWPVADATSDDLYRRRMPVVMHTKKKLILLTSFVFWLAFCDIFISIWCVVTFSAQLSGSQWLSRHGTQRGVDSVNDDYGVEEKYDSRESAPVFSSSFNWWFYAEHSLVCHMLAIEAQFFFIASALWYALISFSLWRAVLGYSPFGGSSDEAIAQFIRRCHVFVWSLTAVLTTVPFVFNVYGNDPTYIGHGHKREAQCWIAPRHKLWTLTLYVIVAMALVSGITLVAFVTFRWLHAAYKLKKQLRKCATPKKGLKKKKKKNVLNSEDLTAVVLSTTSTKSGPVTVTPLTLYNSKKLTPEMSPSSPFSSTACSKAFDEGKEISYLRRLRHTTRRFGFFVSLYAVCWVLPCIRRYFTLLSKTDTKQTPDWMEVGNQLGVSASALANAIVWFSNSTFQSYLLRYLPVPKWLLCCCYKLGQKKASKLKRTHCGVAVSRPRMQRSKSVAVTTGGYVRSLLFGGGQRRGGRERVASFHSSDASAPLCDYFDADIGGTVLSPTPQLPLPLLREVGGSETAALDASAIAQKSQLTSKLRSGLLKLRQGFGIGKDTTKAKGVETGETLLLNEPLAEEWIDEEFDANVNSYALDFESAALKLSKKGFEDGDDSEDMSPLIRLNSKSNSGTVSSEGGGAVGRSVPPPAAKAIGVVPVAWSGRGSVGVPMDHMSLSAWPSRLRNDSPISVLTTSSDDSSGSFAYDYE